MSGYTIPRKNPDPGDKKSKKQPRKFPIPANILGIKILKLRKVPNSGYFSGFFRAFKTTIPIPGTSGFSEFFTRDFFGIQDSGSLKNPISKATLLRGFLENPKTCNFKNDFDSKFLREPQNFLTNRKTFRSFSKSRSEFQRFQNLAIKFYAEKKIKNIKLKKLWFFTLFLYQTKFEKREKSFLSYFE